MSLMGSVMGGAMGIPTDPRTIEDVTRDVLREKARLGSCIISIGMGLVEAKAMLPHGEWLPWLREQAGFSERSAQMYMQVAADPQMSANAKLISYLGIARAAKVAGLPETAKIELIGAAANAAGACDAMQLVDSRIKKRRLEPPEKAEPTITRWDAILSGGVVAMAELLAAVRAHPEQFVADFGVWLMECNGL